MKLVLQKFIAISGYCSRRKAEELIRQKKVKVNGKLAELGVKVNKDDDVYVNNKKLKIDKKKIYIILNKPAGYTCTNRKFKGEKNIFTLLPQDIYSGTSLHIAGRLDKNSRGLILLTNDGELTQKLTHPKFKHEKQYIVEIKNKQIKNKKILEQLKKGVNIGGKDGVTKTKNIEYLGNNRFNIVLTEGKKRQIKRMFKAVGLDVVDLLRIRIKNLQLGSLKEGQWRYLNHSEIIKLISD